MCGEHDRIASKTKFYTRILEIKMAVVKPEAVIAKRIG